MADQPIRIGLIGAGKNTRNMHIPGFHKIAGVELAAVANRSEASGRKVARQEGIPKVAGHWREIVDDPEIDAVCIGTWPYLHAEATVAALEAGKHVLCEARMANDLEEARRMLAASRARPELVAQLVPAPFSLDFDTTIRRMVRDGGLGDLLEVRVVQTGGQSAPPDAPMTWRQDRELSGKNVLTMGIMHETVERWMETDPEWVVADGAVFREWRSYPDSDEARRVTIPESLSVFGRYGADGPRLVYHFSSVESGQARMELRVNGSKGALRFDVFEKQLLFAEAGSEKDKKITINREESRGWRVEEDFVRSIREGAPVELTSFAQGVRYMRFTEMVADSVEGGGVRTWWRDYGEAE